MLKGRINLKIANMPYKLLLKGHINLEIAKHPYKHLLNTRINFLKILNTIRSAKYIRIYTQLSVTEVMSFTMEAMRQGWFFVLLSFLNRDLYWETKWE